MKKLSMISVFFFISFMNVAFGDKINTNKLLYGAESKINSNYLYKSKYLAKNQLYQNTGFLNSQNDKESQLFKYIKKQLIKNPNNKNTIINTINLIKTNKSLKPEKAEIIDSLYQYTIGYPNYYLNLTTLDKENISNYIYQNVYNYFLTGDKISILELDINIDFEKIFVTILSDNKIRCCMSGKSKDDLSKYLQEASISCIQDERFGGILDQNEINDIEISVSILYNKHPISNKSINNYQQSIEPGIHGIEISNGNKKGFFKETVQISKNYNTQYALSRLCKKVGLTTDCYKDPKTDITLYDTISFKSSKNINIKDLYRYNIFIPNYSINSDTLYNSIEIAQQRFLNTVNKDSGLLEYIYYPSKNKYESEENNHIRQFGSLWSMSEIDKFLNTKAFENLIQASLDYYLQFLTDKEGAYYIDIHKSTIANNAFMIMILLNCDIYNLNYPNGEDRESLLNKLGKGLVAMQQEDGSFKTKFTSDTISGIDFYPGESLLALMKLYNDTKNEIYFNTVKKAFPYYSKYWRGNKNTAFIPWQTQAYYLFYLIEPSEEISNFIFEMNDRIVDQHQIFESEYLDKFGGFPKNYPRCSTSSFLEGITDAYMTAILASDKDHIEKYKKSLIYGSRFILQTQFNEENSFYLEEPNKAIGGFKASLINNELRNDYTQHASSALIKVYKNKIFE